MSRFAPRTSTCAGCVASMACEHLIGARPHGAGPLDVMKRGASLAIATSQRFGGLCDECQRAADAFADLLDMPERAS